MRGFRASRAAQNFKSSHFGRQDQYQQNNGFGPGQNQDPQKKVIQLPEWLRMPVQKEPKIEKVAVKKVAKPRAVAKTVRPVKTAKTVKKTKIAA